MQKCLKPTNECRQEHIHTVNQFTLHRVPPVLRLRLRTACRDWCFPEANASAYCWCCDCVYALHAATIAFLKQMPVRALHAAWCFSEANARRLQVLRLRLCTAHCGLRLPAVAHCDIHPHEGVGWVGKEK